MFFFSFGSATLLFLFFLPFLPLIAVSLLSVAHPLYFIAITYRAYYCIQQPRRHRTRYLLNEPLVTSFKDSWVSLTDRETRTPKPEALWDLHYAITRLECRNS
jgi:hypothetical protein